MALARAIGNSPILFTDVNGDQITIPLSAITFDAATVKADGWPPFGSLPSSRQSAFLAWLNQLVQSGAIVAGPAPPPTPAILFTAVNPGSAGNDIQISLANVVPDSTTPANTTVDITVTETDTYPLLTPATIGDVLGVDANAGSTPGLVHARGAGPYTLPKAKDYTLAGGGSAASASIPVEEQRTTNPAFTLEALKKGADGNIIQVSIRDVNATDQTFTLVASWSKSATGVKLSDITSTFGFLIKADPPGGGAFAPPVPGIVVLSGGRDAAGAAAANAIATSG